MIIDKLYDLAVSIAEAGIDDQVVIIDVSEEVMLRLHVETGTNCWQDIFEINGPRRVRIKVKDGIHLSLVNGRRIK